MNSELNDKKEQLREIEEVTDFFAVTSDKMERIFGTEKTLFLGFAIFQILLGLILIAAGWFWYSFNFVNLFFLLMMVVAAMIPIYFGMKKIALMIRTWVKFRRVAKMIETMKMRKAALEKEITEKQ